MVTDVSSARDAIEIIESMYDTGWSDGLPVVPPTRERVREFVEASGRPAGDLVATLPPMGGRATIE